MLTTIADLWFLTQPNDYVPDLRSPLFSSRQIEREVHRANAERRGGCANWSAIALEEVMRMYLERASACIYVYQQGAAPRNGVGSG